MWDCCNWSLSRWSAFGVPHTRVGLLTLQLEVRDDGVCFPHTCGTADKIHDKGDLTHVSPMHVWGCRARMGFAKITPCVFHARVGLPVRRNRHDDRGSVFLTYVWDCRGQCIRGDGGTDVSHARVGLQVGEPGLLRLAVCPAPRTRGVAGSCRRFY